MNAVKPIAKSTWWGPYLQSAFIATISFFCFLLLLIQGAEWLEHSLIDWQKEQVHQDLPIYGVSLTHEYYQYLSILQEFDSWVSAHQPVLSDDAIAQELNAWVETYQPIQVIDPDPNDSDYRHVHGIPGIRSFFYADEGGLRWVHPSALGSHWVPEASLRFQPNSHSNNTVLQIVNVTVPNIGEKAMLVISQPLNRGGYRVQAVGILVDIESWMDGAGIEPGLGEAAIGIRDPHGTQVFGDGRVFGNDPVIYAIDLSGSIWEIGADFEKGWAAAVEPQLVLFWVVSLAIIGLISLIIYLFLIRRIRLKNLIAQHNREMEEVIWQRRRIEQALLANEARFRLIYENLPIGYHSLNIRGELIDVNRAWLDMLGYSRVEVIGSKFTDYLTVESAEFFETFFTDYKAKGQAADVELEMVHKDGSVLMTVLDGRIGYDEEGQFRQTHCILRDVTESKRAELALRESEARYSSLFHDNNSVMLLVDPENGKIVDANPAACDFYGYPAETIKNKNIDDINMLPPVQVSRHMSHAEAGKERRFEFRHRLQNGEIRDVEVYSGPIILQGRRLLYSIVHDISQRKRAQEALKISREELQRERDLISRVMETSPVSIFMVNRSDQVTFANAHACRTFHLQKEAVDSIYQTPGFQLLDLIGQPVAQGKLPFYRLIRDGGAIYNRLYAMDWPGGERSFLSVSGAPVFKESGEIDAAIVIAEDVTEDVLSEKALRESEERFRSAFEFATVGMALTRLDGRFMMVNQALCDMLGYTEVELVGKIYTDLTYAEDLPMNKELFQQSLEGERRSFAMEKRYLHKNGNFVWVSLDSSLMYDPDGTPLYFITHMQDITRGKEAEEALKSSEARYRLLFERNPQAMWVHDNETLQFLAVNEAMERQYGYSQEEFLRMTILEIRPPQEIPSLLEMARSAGDSYTPSGVWKHRRKDMTLLDVETSSYRIDFGGRSARLVLAVDVTERTQAEAASQQRARELQLLSDVSSSLRQAQTRDAMISILMDKALEVTQADRCALFMFDREGINLASSVGFTTPLKASSLKISDPLFRFSQDESLLFIPNTCASGEFDGSDTFEELRQSVCGCVVLPLKTAEAVIGLIFLGWKDAHDFRPDEQRMLTAIAEIAGNSLHRSGMMELLEQRVSDRTRELSALYALSAVASEARDIHSAIEQSLLRILTAMPDKVGAIHLLNEAGQSLKLACSQGIPTCVLDRIKSIPVGDGLIGGVLIDQEPLLIADLDDIGEIPEWETPDRPAAYLGIPMRSHGKSTGVLSIFSKSANFINLEDIALLASAADQIGVTVENVRLRQQSEQVAVLRERERLARELHDSVTQSLYSLTLFSEVGHRMIHAGDTQQLDHVLSRLSETSLQALKEMRLLVYELRPSALEKDGLIGAIHKRLEAVEKRAGIHTVLLADDRLAFPFNVEEALYGITLEALNNSLKHARANSVTVEIQAIDGHVKLDVVDNGMGFDPKDVSRQGGFGLVTLQERTERLGGKLTIETLPGQGTRVSVVIPDNRLSG